MNNVLSSNFWELDADRCAEAYSSASPFPHAVLENLIEKTVLDAAIHSFPEVDGPHWTNYFHVNERKFGNTYFDTWPKTLQQLAEGLMSDEFVKFLEKLTGIEGLHPDPLFDGGGLHRSERGGYLNVHADYSKHHVHPDWRRQVNVLLYLNDEWEEEWGGQLELWTADMQRKERSISPRSNRMVVFSTTSTAFHGHPEPLQCPPNVARKSLALYYFTDGDTSKARATDYKARPGDGAKRLAIFLDVKALRIYDVIKRRLGLSDEVVSRYLSRLSRRKDP